MRRNKWVHEGNFINPNVLTKEAQAYVHEFQKVNELATSATDENVNKNENVKWSAPTQGWLKVNWDVAIDKASGRMGIGAVVREEKGNVIAAMCKTQSGSFEPTMGEALASFHAAILCKDLGIQQIVLEGDAKVVVDAINSSKNNWSLFGHIVEDTRGVLQNFSGWRCGFIHREANEAAHRLAREAITNGSDRIWRDQIPNCISDIILMEQVALSFDC